MLSIELCAAVPADKALLSAVPAGVLGGYFRINDFLQAGEAPPGLEQTFPSAPAKGGKGLSQESALADYKIQSDSLPVYQDPILNHNDS